MPFWLSLWKIGNSSLSEANELEQRKFNSWCPSTFYRGQSSYGLIVGKRCREVFQNQPIKTLSFHKPSNDFSLLYFSCHERSSLCNLWKVIGCWARPSLITIWLDLLSIENSTAQNYLSIINDKFFEKEGDILSNFVLFHFSKVFVFVLNNGIVWVPFRKRSGGCPNKFINRKLFFSSSEQVFEHSNAIVSSNNGDWFCRQCENIKCRVNFNASDVNYE